MGATAQVSLATVQAFYSITIKGEQIQALSSYLSASLCTFTMFNAHSVVMYTKNFSLTPYINMCPPNLRVTAVKAYMLGHWHMGTISDIIRFS